MTKLHPPLGFGLGLRPDHYPYIFEHKPPVDWFEIITENFLLPGGRPLHNLNRIRQDYPIVMHGVSLSIGSTDPLNMDYLKKVKDLMQAIEPAWVSDHLCWTGVNGINLHDLMPLPYTEETINHVVGRLNQVQDFLGRRLLIENVSSYITYMDSVMSEWEFLSAVAEKADCLILLDINNIYVSSYNHKFNPHDYLYAVPKNRVQQFHLAGHLNKGDYIIDTHDASIIENVWDLYQDAVKHFGNVSTMIERDDNIPPFPELMTELMHAKSLYEQLMAIPA